MYSICIRAACDSDYVAHQLAPRFFHAFHNAHLAGGDVDRIEAQNLPTADPDLEAEPVGPEQAAGSIKSHRGGDLTFALVSSAGEEPLAQLLAPRTAANQGLVHKRS